MLTTKLKKLICSKVLEQDVLQLLVAKEYLTDVNDMESLTSKAEQALANKKVKVELSHHLFDKLLVLWPDMTKNTYSATNSQFNLYVNSHDYIPLTDISVNKPVNSSLSVLFSNGETGLSLYSLAA